MGKDNNGGGALFPEGRRRAENPPPYTGGHRKGKGGRLSTAVPIVLASGLAGGSAALIVRLAYPHVRSWGVFGLVAMGTCAVGCIVACLFVAFSGFAMRESRRD